MNKKVRRVLPLFFLLYSIVVDSLRWTLYTGDCNTIDFILTIAFGVPQILGLPVLYFFHTIAKYSLSVHLIPTSNVLFFSKGFYCNLYDLERDIAMVASSLLAIFLYKKVYVLIKKNREGDENP